MVNTIEVVAGIGRHGPPKQDFFHGDNIIKKLVPQTKGNQLFLKISYFETRTTPPPTKTPTTPPKSKPPKACNCTSLPVRIPTRIGVPPPREPATTPLVANSPIPVKFSSKG